MGRDCFWMLAVILVAGALLLSSMSRAQEAMVTVPEAQLRQMLAEHVAALHALQAAEQEVARLKVKLACV